MHTIDIGAFKKRLRTTPGSLALADRPKLRKTITGTAIESGPRRLRFTISTEAVDLDNDVVRQAGWDLKTYLTNPVCFFNHKTDELPVARCVAIGLEKGVLKATAEFVPAEMPVIGDLAEALYRMCRAGFLSATSVGFMPLDFEIARNREDNSGMPPVNFKRQRLLEFSFCGIPANSEALLEPGQSEPDAAKGATMTPEQKHKLNAVFERHRRIARYM